MSKNYNIGGESFNRPGRVRDFEGEHPSNIGRERHELIAYLRQHMENCDVCHASGPGTCEIALDIREQFNEAAKQ